MDITTLLKLAVNHGASDLHLSADLPPILRIDGELQPLDLPTLQHQNILNLIHVLMTNQQRQCFEQQQQVDFAIEIAQVSRCRVHVFWQSRGIAVVFRIIPAQIPTLQQLAMGEIFQQICNLPHGLVLVTGPTGSGKSTTLAAMLQHINHTRHAHVLSIEDPIEFVHISQHCLFHQRELGQHSQNFDTALHAALRADPDIIFIGELRDIESIRLALSAAETGHLVFATLHTNSASKAIDRIIDVFPAAEKELRRIMLSESLQAVIAQVLIKKIAGGRIAAHEIMLATPAIRNLIRENKVAQMYSCIQSHAQIGMTTLDQSLKVLVKDAIINVENARFLAKYPENFTMF